MLLLHSAPRATLHRALLLMPLGPPNEASAKGMQFYPMEQSREGREKRTERTEERRGDGRRREREREREREGGTNREGGAEKGRERHRQGDKRQRAGGRIKISWGVWKGEMTLMIRLVDVRG